MDKKRFKDIFTYPKEGLSRKARWFFGLPLCFTFWVLLSMFLPSFGHSAAAQNLRLTVSYVLFIILLLLTVKYFNGFDVSKLFCDERFRTGSFSAAFLSMLATMGLSYLAIHLSDPTAIVFSASLETYAEDALLSFAMLSASAVFEELVFRSYIAFFLRDSLETQPGKQCVYCLVSGAVFAVVHWSNPEVAGEGVFWAMPFYFIMGAVLMMMVFWTKGIEASLGLHLANNLFAAWFVSYDNAVIETNSLFRQNYGEGPLMLVQSIVCLGISAWIVYMLSNSNNSKKELSNE